MKNTKRVGDITEAKIMSALLSKGVTVLKPFGDNERYDLVIEKDGIFSRVQCKTVRLRNGALVGSPNSSSCGNFKYYEGQVEYFGLYSPELNACYLTPVGKSICLRVIDPLKKQGAGKIKWAKDFEI